MTSHVVSQSPAAVEAAAHLWGSLASVPRIGAATLVGLIAWGQSVDLMALAVCMVLIWARASSRLEAFLVALGYYIAGSRSIVPAAVEFFSLGDNHTTAYVLWIGCSVFLALPWTICYARPSQRPVLRTLLLIVLLSAPPFGVIGWMNPLLSASTLIPGLGLGSLLAGVIVIYCLITKPRARCGSGLQLLLLAAVGVHAASLPETPKGFPEWTAINTVDKREPRNLTSMFKRFEEITIDTLTEIERGKKVVIFPEWHAGPWSKYSEVYIKSSLGPALRRYGATVVIGAGVPTEDDPGRFYNTLIIYDGHLWRQHHARMVMPTGLHAQWRNQSTVPNWTGKGSVQLGGVQALISVCFEDVMILPILESALLDRPRVIVSVANAWWDVGAAASRVQAQHINAWARIFDLPLVRAGNSAKK